MRIRHILLPLALSNIIACVAEKETSSKDELPVNDLFVVPLNEAPLRKAGEHELQSRINNGARIIRDRGRYLLVDEGGREILYAWHPSSEHNPLFGFRPPWVSHSADLTNPFGKLPQHFQRLSTVSVLDDSRIVNLAKKNGEIAVNSFFKSGDDAFKLADRHIFNDPEFEHRGLYAAKNSLISVAVQNGYTANYFDQVYRDEKGDYTHTSFGTELPEEFTNGIISVSGFDVQADGLIDLTWNIDIEGSLVSSIVRNGKLYLVSRYDLFKPEGDIGLDSLPVYTTGGEEPKSLVSDCLVSSESRFGDAFNTLMNITIVDINEKRLLKNICINENLSGAYFGEQYFYIGGSDYKTWQNPKNLQVGVEAIRGYDQGRTVFHKFSYSDGLPKYLSFASIPGRMKWYYPEENLSEIRGGLAAITHSFKGLLVERNYRYQLYTLDSNTKIGDFAVSSFLPNEQFPESLTPLGDNPVGAELTGHLSYVRFADRRIELQTTFQNQFFGHGSSFHRSSASILIAPPFANGGYEPQSTIASSPGERYEYAWSISPTREIAFYPEVIGKMDANVGFGNPYLYKTKFELRDISKLSEKKVLLSRELEFHISFRESRPDIFIHYDNDENVRIARKIRGFVRLFDITDLASDLPILSVTDHDIEGYDGQADEPSDKWFSEMPFVLFPGSEMVLVDNGQVYRIKSTPQQRE